MNQIIIAIVLGIFLVCHGYQNLRPFLARRVLSHYNIDSGHKKISAIATGSMRDIISKHKKANSPKKLLAEIKRISLDHNDATLAIKSLHRMNRTDLALEVVPLWAHSLTNQSIYDQLYIDNALFLLKFVCRLRRMDLADLISNSCNLFSSKNSINITAELSPHYLKINQLMLPELAMGYAGNGTFTKTRAILENMRLLRLPVELELSKQVLKHTLRDAASSFDVLEVLRQLLVLGGLVDNDSIQLLSSAYLRSIEFVKGAVSMATLPEPLCPEVAFIGRSNVGKSSLINMICNRKGLAYTSKTPGKTSEFNYFDARGIYGRASTPHRFYLVDLPGVGYAEVSRDMKSGWLKLLREYATQRESLALIFHLVDSRHGLLESDEACLSLLDDLPERVRYCVVLTKADKKDGAASLSDPLIARVRRALQSRTARDVPILLTSSESRQGGAAMWAELLEAVDKAEKAKANI